MGKAEARMELFAFRWRAADPSGAELGINGSELCFSEDGAGVEKLQVTAR